MNKIYHIFHRIFKSFIIGMSIALLGISLIQFQAKKDTELDGGDRDLIIMWSLKAQK